MIASSFDDAWLKRPFHDFFLSVELVAKFSERRLEIKEIFATN